MKRSLLFFAALFTFSTLFAQTEITWDRSGNKVVKGFITKKDLVTDTAFAWYAENQKGYTPEASALQTLKQNKDSVHFIAFGGTWCGDTKYIFPKFFNFLDAAGFNQNNVTVIGVDENKKTIQHLAEAFKVVNVPTLIVMKNGQEIGRVVEYGKYGMFDKEIGEIITNAKK